MRLRKSMGEKSAWQSVLVIVFIFSNDYYLLLNQKGTDGMLNLIIISFSKVAKMSTQIHLKLLLSKNQWSKL